MRALSVLIAMLFVFSSGSLVNAEVIRIDIGKNKGSSKDDLEERVWQLERAVRQLQDRIYDLEGKPNHGAAIVAAPMFTCQIESFGKMFTATEPTKMAATAKVLKDCSKATNSIHCDKEKVECGN